jgi:hypothetical protein
MTLPITTYEAKRNFSQRSLIKNKLQLTTIEERLNYLSILSTENGITKSLSYEDAIKDRMQPKIVEKGQY